MDECSYSTDTFYPPGSVTKMGRLSGLLPGFLACSWDEQSRHTSTTKGHELQDLMYRLGAESTSVVEADAGWKDEHATLPVLRRQRRSPFIG